MSPTVKTTKARRSPAMHGDESHNLTLVYCHELRKVECVLPRVPDRCVFCDRINRKYLHHYVLLNIAFATKLCVILSHSCCDDHILLQSASHKFPFNADLYPPSPSWGVWLGFAVALVGVAFTEWANTAVFGISSSKASIRKPPGQFGFWEHVWQLFGSAASQCEYAYDDCWSSRTTELLDLSSLCSFEHQFC